MEDTEKSVEGNINAEQGRRKSAFRDNLPGEGVGTTLCDLRV
jgi:hypothetical protein